MTAEELKAFLERSAGSAVTLVVTDNRCNVIKSRRLQDGSHVARIHRIFLEASDEVLRALGKFIKNPDRSNREVIDGFVRENFQRIRRDTARKPAKDRLNVNGRNHDLEKIFDSLNRRYFKGKCDAAYTWGKRPAPGNRRSIRFGSYDFVTNTIRLHPVLDQAFVPRYVVETILYHEMLHWYIPPKGENGRRYVHTSLFRQGERLHPQFERAERWRKLNLDRLLRG